MRLEKDCRSGLLGGLFIRDVVRAAREGVRFAIVLPLAEYNYKVVSG